MPQASTRLWRNWRRSGLQRLFRNSAHWAMGLSLVDDSFFLRYISSNRCLCLSTICLQQYLTRWHAATIKMTCLSPGFPPSEASSNAIDRHGVGWIAPKLSISLTTLSWSVCDSVLPVDGTVNLMSACHPCMYSTPRCLGRYSVYTSRNDRTWGLLRQTTSLLYHLSARTGCGHRLRQVCDQTNTSTQGYRALLEL